MIKVTHLNKKYGETNILTDISFEFPDNSIIGVTGENGVGKTTLFKCLLGIYSSGGEIINSGCYKKVIFDEPPKLKGMTVENYIHYFYLLYKNRNEDGIDLDSILKKVNLLPYKRKKVSDLSYGMKKTLYISTLLIGKTDFAIIDEPFNGLDKKAREIVKNILLDLKRTYNATIIISSHMQDQLEDICNFFYEIKNGTVQYISNNKHLLKYEITINDLKNREMLDNITYDELTEKLIHYMVNNKDKIEIKKRFG